MTNKKPEITRTENVVHINCFEEKAAITCEKEIVKVLNNRMLRARMAMGRKRNG